MPVCVDIISSEIFALFHHLLSAQFHKIFETSNECIVINVSELFLLVAVVFKV